MPAIRGSAPAAFDSPDLAQASRLFHALAADYPWDGPARFYRHLCSSQADAPGTVPRRSESTQNNRSRRVVLGVSVSRRRVDRSGSQILCVWASEV